VFSNFISNVPNKYTSTVEKNIYILKYLVHASVRIAPSSGRTNVTCSKLSADCNAVALVTIIIIIVNNFVQPTYDISYAL
jgi:hypothetical protein